MMKKLLKIIFFFPWQISNNLFLENVIKAKKQKKNIQMK